MKVHTSSSHRDPKKNLHYSRSRPEHLISQQGVHPAPSLGESEAEDLGPTTQKRMCFVDEEIMHYRSLLGLACSAAAYSDGLLKDPERKHLFDYLQWIHDWMIAGMEPKAFLTLARRLEASRRRWDLVRQTLVGEFEMGLWEAIEPYTGGEEYSNIDIEQAVLDVHQRHRVPGPTSDDVVVPDSDGGPTGSQPTDGPEGENSEGEEVEVDL